MERFGVKWGETWKNYFCFPCFVVLLYVHKLMPIWGKL
ncbi:hypothetical protein AO368_1643 [Moraxella catarrhalis]|nr:hypothetical protein AO376_1747 [Moraxella catarrhalis]OAV19590.1 hypothetical protein AO374_0648 [Moraxella catarrhalis]OAV27659.1 hypothetical protein AO368_1643 [Moraxella catarrhalis]